jgi:hypothetical protein
MPVQTTTKICKQCFTFNRDNDIKNMVHRKPLHFSSRNFNHFSRSCSMKTGKYTFHIRLQDPAYLPFYKGSTFRGVLGHALRRIVCALKRTECAACILRTHCTYAQVFETKHACPAPEGARVSDPPHPMVIEPPLTPQTKFTKGETLTCTLMLFGGINQNLPYFVYAFDQMGKLGIGRRINGSRTKFQLEAVTHGDTTLYQKGRDRIDVPDTLPDITFAPAKTPPAERLRLTTITPLRITGREKGPADLPFQDLVRSLIRRNTALLNTWGSGEPDMDYSILTQQAADVVTTRNQLTWFDWKRYSARQDTKMFMGGLTGVIEYTGNLTPFLPLLHMGQVVHAGKNTAFGLGQFVTEF